MSATYYLILTAYGAQRIAQLQADQSSAPLLVNFVAGDANGNPYLPQTRINATALIHQRVSVPLQSVDVVDADRCQAVAVLDATVGGFNIHEIGITDDTGQLVYIGNYHGGYKPALSEGAGGDLTLVLDLVASGLATVIISPDASFIYAGRDWVDANFVSIPTFNAHIAQNTLEHANLLSLINSVNQRISDLEIREEIQIGEFVITDDPRNPSSYKGYGSWRLVPDVLLKGLATGGVTGQFSQLTAGSGQQVRSTFFWQRFDPSAVTPLRTITISSDATDVDLLSLFISTYGQPVSGERVKFIVAAGVLVTASSTSGYAVTTGVWPPLAQLTLEILGSVVGRGGRGGASAINQHLNNGGALHLADPDKWVKPAAGENGGDAILATSTPLEVINNNILAGGGGGGGGMGAWVAEILPAGGGTNYVAGVGCGGGAGGGAPFGLRAPNQNTYEAYLLDPLFPLKGDRSLYSSLGFLVCWDDSVKLFDQSYSAAGATNLISIDDFGSKSTDINLRGDYVFPHYTDSSNLFYLVKTNGKTSKPIRMSQDATQDSGGIGGYGSSQNNYLYFTEQSLPADLSLNYGGRGGDIGQNGQAGVIQAFYKDNGSTVSQSQVALHIPSAAGGLAGIALTGPITLTGNPAIGR